jgi:LysR family glycine cleavage system transcriptional activator
MHRLRSLVPSANYLFVFEAAARRRSFTGAATELNISQPAVSKTIHLLEEASGLKLFHRNHNKIELSAEGARLYAEIQESFDRIHMVITSLQTHHSDDVIRASFSSSFLKLWLLPRLADFTTKYPDISLRLEESTRDDQNLVEEDIDISARMGHGEWQGLSAWHFVTEEIRPVCSPAYLATIGSIESPAELSRHKLLHFEERHRSRPGWKEWLANQGVQSAKLKQTFVFTDAHSSIEAAVLGQGIALGWKHLIHDHVRAGRLIAPLSNSFKTGRAIYIVMPSERRPKPGAALFRDWLIAQDADVDPFR